MTGHRLGASTVLMYHSVCEAPARPRFAPYVVTPSLLERQLAALAEAGFTADSTVHSTDVNGSRSVVLTFDDGFRDFYDVVLPILDRLRMRAALFIPTGYLRGTARWLDPEGEGLRPMLDEAQVREVAASGLVEIGAHSHAHPPLDLVDAARRRSEIRLPRIILEDLVQTPIRAFAYPFGYFNAGTRRDVARAGYELAYGVGERHATSRDNRLAIPRWSVGPNVAPADLVRLVRSASPASTKLSSAAKRHIRRQQLRIARSPITPPARLPPLPRHGAPAEHGR